MKRSALREHHDIVETSAKDTSNNLGCKCDLRREFVLLGEF